MAGNEGELSRDHVKSDSLKREAEAEERCEPVEGEAEAEARKEEGLTDERW